MGSVLRLATPADAAGIQAIYAPIVRDTVISFEFDPPTVEEIARRVANTLVQWPWLVCERDSDVVGYAYASRHRERAAYQWSVDVSVYIHERARRSGVGRALYSALLPMVTLQGFYNATPASRCRTPPASRCTRPWGSPRWGSTMRSATSSARGTTSAGGSDRCSRVVSIHPRRCPSTPCATRPSGARRCRQGSPGCGPHRHRDDPNPDLGRRARAAAADR